MADLHHKSVIVSSRIIRPTQSGKDFSIEKRDSQRLLNHILTETLCKKIIDMIKYKWLL